MTKLTTTLVIAIAAVGLSLGGCKKKNDAPAAGSGSGTASGSMAGSAGSGAGTAGSGSMAGSAGSGAGSMAGSAGSGAGSVAEPVPVSSDSFKVTAAHVDPAKPNVDVVFGKLTVKAAKFDPKNLEGGTAEVEVDVTSLSTGVADRDKHLQSPDYLDAVKFPVITIKIDNVKKAGSDTSFTADATVNAHGIEKKIPLKFDVTATTDDSVTVKVNHTFSRKDFAVGGPGDAKDPVKFDLVLDAVLTLKNT